MAIIVNTNMSALKTQKNLNTATNSLTQSLERMSTGLKINSAKDDAAGMFVANSLNTQIRGAKVAQDNIATGTNVLQTMEGDLDVIMDNLNRIRDLAVQASNSIYSEESMQAMKNEVDQRIAEIDRIALASNFNGLNLLSAAGGNDKLFREGLRLQVGANAEDGANSITLSNKDFFNANFDSTGLKIKDAAATAFAQASTAADYIATIDTAINTITQRKATIGATQNRLASAEASLTTTIENATAAKSTIMDADIAEEAAEFTKAQILQQTSSALLKQANQIPSIALTLVS